MALNLERLKELLATFPKVKFALLFGSYARGKAFPFSDLDIAILFDEEPELLELGKMTATLEKETGLEVDILPLNSLYERDPALAYEVITTGKLLFCRDEEAFVLYKKYTFLYYFDHQPLFERVWADLKRRLREGKFGKLGSP